eukprot:s155_g33.t1
MEAFDKKVVVSGGTVGDWWHLGTSGFMPEFQPRVVAGNGSSAALDLARTRMSKDPSYEYEGLDDFNCPQGKALLRLVGREDISSGVLEAILMLARDGCSEGYATNELADGRGLHRGCSMVKGQCPERLGPGDWRQLNQCHKWRMASSLMRTEDEYVQPVVLRAIEVWIEASKPVVIEPILTSPAPVGKWREVYTVLGEEMGGLGADPDSANKEEPLRVKAVAVESAFKTPEVLVAEVGRRGPGLLVHFRQWRWFLVLVLCVSVSTQSVLFRTMEFGVVAPKPVVPEPWFPPPLLVGEGGEMVTWVPRRRGEGLELAIGLDTLGVALCRTTKGFPLRGTALAEGPTDDLPRVVVGMVLEEDSTERGIDQLERELARKRWNIKGAPIREPEVGRDAQAGLVLAERLVAAVGSRFCCVVSQSAPLDRGGLVVQSIVGAGNLWKDSMSELCSVRNNMGPGGGAKVGGKFSVHAVLGLPTTHERRANWPGNAMVKCCVAPQSAPLERGGLGLQSTVVAGKRWKDPIIEWCSFLTNIGPGGAAKVGGNVSVHAVLTLPTAHGKRAIWPGNTMVKVLKGGVRRACFPRSWSQQGPRSHTSWDRSGRTRFKIEPVCEMSSEVSSEFKRVQMRMFRKAHQGSPPGPFIRSGGRKADLIPEEGEKPDACAPVEEQSSFEISHGGNEAEHSIGLLWSELKTPANACLRAFRLGGRSALSKYRSVTRLWVLLSLPIMPESDDGTTGARQRSLLPSPLREDSQLALLDFLNTGRTCPPAGGGEKAAFGGPGAQMPQPRSLSIQRVPGTDLVRSQSEAMEAISSLPLTGGCQCLFSGVRILYPVDMLGTPRLLALDSMKPEGPASVVLVFMAGAESSKREPRVQLDDQEVWVWPKWKRGEFIPQPKGRTSLGQMNPVVAKLFYHGLSTCPKGPLQAEGNFGRSGSFGVRVPSEYCVVEWSGLQFLMECKAKGPGSEALAGSLRTCLH